MAQSVTNFSYYMLQILWRIIPSLYAIRVYFGVFYPRYMHKCKAYHKKSPTGVGPL